MDISVIICTWNRSALLDQTLHEMRKLKIPQHVEWELIVVNNNCTDDTDAVITRHAAHLPIRRLFQGAPGKSAAANLAIEQARGNLLLWTDDDVLVDPDWLAEYAKAAQGRPDVTYFGGPVEPWFAVEPPKWISRNMTTLAGAYAVRRIGTVTRPIEEPEFPYGVNMAIRRHAFDTVSFDTRIGPQGTSHIRGEEIELLSRFNKLGFRGLWVVSAGLRHYIPPERLTYKYIWSYFVGASRTEERLRGRQETKSWFGVPPWAIKRYLFQSALVVFLAPFKNHHWLKAVMRAARTMGIIVETRARSYAVG